ncbi:hypothetical protein ARMGADRAFT_1085496 [Armillaria gallica]|uniref:Uncharacterized protein n=1 Tax=Armillaria gallica TaxID=47427 RepID=A0A2H3DJ46_ARMGA|nr:hypothetical protein ARMGADRAFT_1085496 [Armillaria gallica]
MSSASIPPRGQCIQHTDNIHEDCQCSWFVSTLLDQYICDYVSMIVNHYPATQCAAYVQKTPLTQRCTCGTWLSDHVAIDNLYCSEEPWNVLDHAPDNDGLFSNSTGFSNNAINGAYAPTSISFSSADSNTADADLTPVPISSLFVSPYAFSHSGDATLPSASSAPSTTQWDTSYYSSDGYFVQYPDYLINSSYARLPDGGATDHESFEYQHYSPNAMHGAPNAWSGQYD